MNSIRKFKSYIPGLILLSILVVLAKTINMYMPIKIGATTLVIFWGIFVGNLFKIDCKFAPGIKLCEKTLLETSIALFGLKLNIGFITELGLKSLLVIIPLMFVTISFSLLIGNLFKTSKTTNLLLGIGNAVCGSSAIAATAPLFNAKKEEIGISIGVVNLLGSMAIIFFPLLLKQFDVSDLKKSYLIGGTLQAVGHVAAAGFSINDFVGKTSILIKMIRVLMIGPIVITISFLRNFRLKADHNIGNKKRLPLPTFVIFFVLFSIVGSIFKSDTLFVPFLNKFSNLLLMFAMGAIGINIKFKDFIKQGTSALLIGLLTFITSILLLSIFISF